MSTYLHVLCFIKQQSIVCRSEATYIWCCKRNLKLCWKKKNPYLIYPKEEHLLIFHLIFHHLISKRKKNHKKQKQWSAKMVLINLSKIDSIHTPFRNINIRSGKNYSYIRPNAEQNVQDLALFSRNLAYHLATYLSTICQLPYSILNFYLL